MWTQHDDPEESKFEKDFFCKICCKSCKTVGYMKAHMTTKCLVIWHIKIDPSTTISEFKKYKMGC